ncbi:hypothetical protein DV737_g2555, partial [Chaetothyriales sp. CBS 132003]
MTQKRKRDSLTVSSWSSSVDSSKKRAKHSSTTTTSTSPSTREIDTSKPTAVFQPIGPRTHTLSVALPGSIIANAKSHDQKTFLCGTIARALAVFCVDEQSYTGLSNPSHFLAHVLSYLETPPYLRKALFPMHANLRTAGTLPSLDLPSHVRGSEWCRYREGVVVAATGPGNDVVEVDIGLPERRVIKGVKIPANARVTGTRTAIAVSPTTPREQDGYYWGYSVRQCSSLSAVLTESPFDGGYDVSFGTSERGRALSEVLSTSRPPRYRHLLLVFGGVGGLETAAANDAELADRGITGRNVSDLFDHWVNLVPGQGSRTIRTEEAVWLGLMGLRGVVLENE